MEKYDRAFSSAAARAHQAAAEATDALFGRRSVPDEPNLTTSLLTRIEIYLSGFSKGGITWQSQVLSPKTAEPIYGADFVGALKLDLPEYSVVKGFLAQAKRQEPGAALVASKWANLVRECEKMLMQSTESFVFVYALNGIVVVPALNVVSCRGSQDLHTLHPKSIRVFFKEHFQCWIGERIDSKKDLLPWKTVVENVEHAAKEHPHFKGIIISGTASEKKVG